MKIAVLIKQVPVLSKLQFDYEQRRVVRAGVPLEVNVFDILAVHRAVRFKEETEAEVVVITMGPPQAREALVQCLALGADRGILLTDRAMAGADTLATARALALALRREQPDLVLAGRNSVDAETGQVGPEVAELLGLPMVSRVLELHVAGGYATCTREVDLGEEVVRCPVPALITVTEGIAPEEYPKRDAIEAARSKPVAELSAADLGADPALLGAQGSPTQVLEIEVVQPQRHRVQVQEGDPQEAARRLEEAIRERGLLKPRPPLRTPAPVAGASSRSAVWVVAEVVDGTVRPVTFEMLGKAHDLAHELRGEVAAVTLAPPEESLAAVLAAHGADRVLAPQGTLDHPTSPTAAGWLAALLRQYSPYAVLFASTADGRDLASRVAAKLGLGLTGDCIDLRLDGQGRLLQMKPALGGNVVAPIISLTSPVLATMRPGMLTPLAPDNTRRAPVELAALPGAAGPRLELLERRHTEAAEGVALESARIVLGVGMGIEDPENLPAILAQARRINAVLACTRDVVDMGWLPRQIQIGITGRAVAPDLYVAVGVRGAFNHMVGVQKAGTIVAINSSPRAAIFQQCDFGVLGSWQTHLTPVIEVLERALKDAGAL